MTLKCLHWLIQFTRTGKSPAWFREPLAEVHRSPGVGADAEESLDTEEKDSLSHLPNSI